MEKSKGNKYFLKLVTIILVMIFLLSGTLLVLEVWDSNRGHFKGTSANNDAVVFDGKEYALKKNVETFLVMGLDKFEGASASDSYNNDKQADFLMLFVFDNQTKKCSAIHINRDTMTDVNVLGVAGNKVDTVKKQIALAHTYGNGRNVSCQNTAEAVSGLLNGVKVNHYISLSMDSVAVFNDFVGGVDVVVNDDFSGIDDTLVNGQTVTLKGEHALNFVRTRYGLEDSTNSTRMKRQQQYLNALFTKVKDCMAQDDEFSVKAAMKMSDYIISDRSATQLQELGKKINEYEFKGIKEIEGESKLGEEFIEFYPDKQAIQELVISLFYDPKD